MAEVGGHKTHSIPTGREEYLSDNLLAVLGRKAVVRRNEWAIDALMGDSSLLGVTSIESAIIKRIRNPVTEIRWFFFLYSLTAVEETQLPFQCQQEERQKCL
jgi:hypothetical protein